MQTGLKVNPLLAVTTDNLWLVTWKNTPKLSVIRYSFVTFLFIMMDVVVTIKLHRIAKLNNISVFKNNNLLNVALKHTWNVLLKIWFMICLKSHYSFTFWLFLPWLHQIKAFQDAETCSSRLVNRRPWICQINFM